MAKIFQQSNNSFLNHMQSTQLPQPELQSPALKRLLERLDSDWHLTRQSGMRQAEALSEEQLEQLLYLAERHKRRKKWRGTKRFALLLMLALCGDGVLLAIHVPLNTLLPLTGCALFSGWLMVLMPLALFALEQQAYPATLDVCVQSRRPRFVGAALIRLRMLRHTPADESGTAKQKRLDRVQATLDSLTAMLQAVSETQVPILTREQHTLLLYGLEHDTGHIDFMLAALRALPFCGQEDALPVLRRLNNKMGILPQMWEEARDCHAQLEKRLLEARQANSLLRASAISDVAAADTLLRAADSSSPVAPEQLLRSSSVEE